MKRKTVILIICALLFATTMSTITYVVKADSGWDSDYDSDWGDSSWDSDWGGSSWDSDWGSSSSSSYSHSSYGNKDASVAAICFIVFVAIIVIAIVEETNRKDKVKIKNIDRRILEDEIKVKVPSFDKSEFLSKAYDMFINTQNAWMNFDYDTLRKLLSDELYNTYKSQLKVLELQKQKNIMSDFEKIDIDTSNFNLKDNKLTITVELIVSFYDYVINEYDKIVRGTNNRKLTNHYELTFICTINKNNKSNKCPNCNAPLDNVASSTCPYCNSTIVSNNYDWIMSKKQIKR